MEKIYTINQNQVESITDNLFHLQAKVDEGLLSPKDISEKIGLIKDYIHIVVDPVKQ